MLKIGLTGSIGSGKSLVAKVFETLGVEVFYADQEAKLLLLDPEVKAELIRSFGDQILDDDLQIIRKRLAIIVFNHVPSLQALNAIIHPRVRQELRKWLAKRSSASYVIQEAAILFESGFDQECDEVITVSAPEELRIQRVMARDNVSRDDVLVRMRNQWSDAEKVKRADHVIMNDGEHLVIPQVLQIHKKLIITANSK